MTDKKSAFAILNAIDVSGYTEKKNGLTYLSWANAWRELKKVFPQSYYTVYENKDGLIYHTDGKTAWVKTGVTVVSDAESIEHIEYLPVMDFRNRSIPIAQITSFDVNKAVQRSLTKAAARHGLGLSVYAGEDLPETEAEYKQRMASAPKAATASGTAKQPEAARKAQVLKIMMEKFKGIGCSKKEDILPFISQNLQREIKSSTELNTADCEKVIAAIERLYPAA